jgi:hypothetical protein
MMNVKQSPELELEGETEVIGEKLSQCHFFHHKSHMTWPGIESGQYAEKPMTNHLTCGMT